ncbi:betaine/proline/choline family ABC transporter ATP-binding protein [Aquibacillus albus]|uniref:Quaternary amine transport ATP-binding protein n=1 Tax=Aquibacillus albus TaxID=1168171 RepID=A0ABS2MXB3_9BACI|nr:betaine/proline/choline family ABC transporter ATP-binding protein [Aquibacillus albus]MBM7570494.1 osmoprotectant transport system ATP-binding protein [Aquibacillus albus]
MIRLEGVEKVYEDGFQALKDINLEFKEGEINVLIGPSGCGKTTTMKMLNKLIDFTNGNIFINDKDISTIDAIDLRRTIGYVIQHIGLFPHMTIYNNVAAVPKLLKWDKERIDKRVNELLNMVGLDPETYANRFPSELSGGQQQRIGVIRALAAEPSIILMDEPFSALDPISREQLQDELLRLQKEINKTIVFVTHDMDEALKIADQIILMKDGVVEQKGSPEEILRSPASDFVKDFIGQDRLQQGNAIPVVDEVMSKEFVSIEEKQSVTDAIDLMKDKQIDSLMVLSNSHQVTGKLSLYDVINQTEQMVAEVMKPFEQNIESGASLSAALHLIKKHDLNELPVVDQDQQFIGIITRKSLIHVMSKSYSLVGNEGK